MSRAPSKTTQPSHPNHDPIGELCKLLDEELSWFDDNATQLLSTQLEAFSAINKIMFEIEEEDLPKQRRSERVKIRSIMSDIILLLGPEMFLLCAVALPSHRLLSIKHRILLKAFGQWWSSSPRPRGLTTTAASFCGPIQAHVSSARKRKIEELGAVERSEACESGSRFLDESPYCTVIRAAHLQEFLQQNRSKYQAITLRVHEDVQKLPCIEISMDMCQNLIVYAMQEQNKSDLNQTELE